MTIDGHPRYCAARLNLSLAVWREVFAATRKHPRDQRRYRVSDVLAYGWNSTWFSVAESIQRSAFARQLRDTDPPQDPVFVLGFWRSGTTFLHELLCQDERFTFATTTQCMHAATMLLGRRTPAGSQGAIKRPMDDVLVSADSPQEDEFAFLSLGVPSPYRAILLPSEIRSLSKALDPDDLPAVSRRVLENGIQDFLRRLRLIDSRTPVLKSPTHTFRLRILYHAYPRAKFIMALRDPYEVWASNLRLWQALFDRYALVTWRDEDLRTFVAEAYLRMSQIALAARSELPPSRYTEVRFEQLDSDPIGALGHVYQALEWPGFEAVAPRIRRLLEARPVYRHASYSFSEEDTREIGARLGAAIETLGYPLRAPGSEPAPAH